MISLSLTMQVQNILWIHVFVYDEWWELRTCRIIYIYITCINLAILKTGAGFERSIISL